MARFARLPPFPKLRFGKGGAARGRAEPDPRRLLGVGRSGLRRLRLGSAEWHPMPGTKGRRLRLGGTRSSAAAGAGRRDLIHFMRG